MAVDDSGHLEIERKYLLDRLPELPDHAVLLRIEQGYLEPRMETLPEDGLGAPLSAGGRVRRTKQPDGSVICHHTIKQGAGLVRQEWQLTISEDVFESAWNAPSIARLRKVRYQVRDGAVVWEIDDFHELDVVLAEVELPTAQTQVEPPQWLSRHIQRDVTGETAYYNFTLAQQLLAQKRGS